MHRYDEWGLELCAPRLVSPTVKSFAPGFCALFVDDDDDTVIDEPMTFFCFDIQANIMKECAH
jgi:hypothetical protein